MLMLSPMAKGLFAHAICQSGTALLPGIVMQPADVSKQLVSKLANLPGCPEVSSDNDAVISFLRQQPTDVLLGLGSQGEHVAVVVDDHFLPASYKEMFAKGQQSPCDLLLGCNSHEGWIMLKLMAPGFNVKDMVVDLSTGHTIIQQICKQFFPDSDHISAAVIAEYLPDGTEDPTQAVVEFFGNLYFVLNTVDVANLCSCTNRTYLYCLDHRAPFTKAPEWVHSDHSDDVYYVFGMFCKSETFLPLPEGTLDDVQLSHAIMSYWANFAKTGDPNGDGLKTWPKYDEATRPHVVLAQPVTTGSHLKQRRMDFWLKTVPELLKRTSTL